MRLSNEIAIAAADAASAYAWLKHDLSYGSKLYGSKALAPVWFVSPTVRWMFLKRSEPSRPGQPDSLLNHLNRH
jgi:hypothetical protein